VNPEDLGDLFADRHGRIERSHRLLEDHPDPPAADLRRLRPVGSKVRPRSGRFAVIRA
jgi:hypothetical protein